MPDDTEQFGKPYQDTNKNTEIINSSRVQNLNHVPSTATIPGVQQSSEFLHSRLNLLDDQITINYDLS